MIKLLTSGIILLYSLSGYTVKNVKVRGLFIMYQDKTLVCKDCGAEFVWTAGEQEFYAQKGFQNAPVRCKSCRDAKKQRNNQFNSRRGRVAGANK